MVAIERGGVLPVDPAPEPSWDASTDALHDPADDPGWDAASDPGGDGSGEDAGCGCSIIR